ncbi:MAG TPA: HlyD family efflux transporter periplasmic adaptor subunit [Candidatus Methylomirabilis sp.]|nr:HlyD family efflux transporter periplasmic adaptor subunit [Candidatus Methylomirabilis sp.]
MTAAASRVEPAAPSLPRPSRRGRIAIVVLLLGLGLVTLAVWRFAPPRLPPGVIAVSGRIEGDDSAVASKTMGRIRQITVREGDHLEAGQVIAVLDDEQIRARERQAEAAVRQSEARVQLSQRQIGVLNEQLRQNQLAVDQARVDARGRVSEAEGRLAAAESQLAQAEATYAQAKWDSNAATRLFERSLIAEQEARRAQNNEGAQAAVVAAAHRQVEAARGALTAAQANLVNPAIRSAQAAAVEGQILQAEADIAAAQADAERARFQLEEARANRQDLQVIAPFTGTVVTRTAEPGEVVMAGTPIITLLNLAEVYLRGFVPEGEIGKVRVGQPARVYLDSAPTKPIDAFVSRVDPQASFTPENTYFREDRVKQVVGVKLQLRGAVGFAKPGMPADGEILVDGTEWPARSTHR